jgi:hypothetical protein
VATTDHVWPVADGCFRPVTDRSSAPKETVRTAGADIQGILARCRATARMDVFNLGGAALAHIRRVWAESPGPRQ